MRFGIHAGPQDCSIAELRRLWRIADERGFHWCSVWDHLYSVSDLSDPAKPAFEGVATMAALASETKRVRVGCLVFCVCYRPVGLLAKAAVTIDHLSGGRCELGIGAGWNEIEARAFGIPFPSIKERLDRLEETAKTLRALFDGERVTLAGRQLHLEDRQPGPGPRPGRGSGPPAGGEPASHVRSDDGFRAAGHPGRHAASGGRARPGVRRRRGGMGHPGPPGPLRLGGPRPLHSKSNAGVPGLTVRAGFSTARPEGC